MINKTVSIALGALDIAVADELLPTNRFSAPPRDPRKTGKQRSVREAERRRKAKFLTTD